MNQNSQEIIQKFDALIGEITSETDSIIAIATVRNERGETELLVRESGNGFAIKSSLEQVMGVKSIQERARFAQTLQQQAEAKSAQ